MSKSITCPSCRGTCLVKNGFSRCGKKQRYKCKSCQRQFVEDGWKWFVSASTKSVIGRLLLERLSLQGICRACGVSMSWLMQLLGKLYESQPADLNVKIEQQKQASQGRTYLKMMKVEVDEMWTFVKQKANKQWLWLAQHTASGQIIAFHVGSRGEESARQLWQNMPQGIKGSCLVYSDGWNAYKGALPAGQHCYSKSKGDTNHLERFNNTLRQRASRLVRKSLAFSKAIHNHIGAIKYFICNYNLSLHL
jgi:insertion element IS1 protein InsB